jgi:MFS family permease
MTTPSAWRPRSLYTCTFFWISAVGGRFLVVFLEHQGHLTPTELGSILALAQIVTVVASFVTGSYADLLETYYPHRGRASIFALGILVGSVVFGGHALTVPGVPPVLWHGALRLVMAIATAMIFPVMDGMCLEYLAESSSTQDYGKERLYGAVSWGVANMIAAVGLEYVGFSILYVMTLVSTSLTLVVLWMYTKSQDTRRSYEKRDSNIMVDSNEDEDDDDKVGAINNQKSLPSKRSNTSPSELSSSISSTFHILRSLCVYGFGTCFAISQITQSSGQAIVDNLIFLYFEQLQSSYLLMGWTVVLTVAFEIPLFQIAPMLLKAGGAGILIPIAAVSYVVRVYGYSIIPEGHVAYVLCLEPLHGVTYACMAMASVELISSLTPPGYAASGQSALQVLVGTGSVLGLFLGGYLQDELGPRLMYRISAMVVAMGCTLFVLALWICPPPLTAAVHAPTQPTGSSTTKRQDHPSDDTTDNNDAVELVQLVQKNTDGLLL